MTLFVVVMVICSLTIVSQAFADETSGTVSPDKQGGETTMTVETPSYVTTTPVSQETSAEVAGSEPEEGSVGLPSSDLENGQPVASPTDGPTTRAEDTTLSVVPPPLLSKPPIAKVTHRVKPKKVRYGRYGLPSTAKRFRLKTLKSIVSKVGKKLGCTKREIRELNYIWQREMRNNKGIGGANNHFLGMWQLYYTMCRGKPWWNPYWQTKRAIRYMRHHSYAGYGKGIHAAYKNKRARGWY